MQIQIEMSLQTHILSVLILWKTLTNKMHYRIGLPHLREVTPFQGRRLRWTYVMSPAVAMWLRQGRSRTQPQACLIPKLLSSTLLPSPLLQGVTQTHVDRSRVAETADMLARGSKEWKPWGISELTLRKCKQRKATML